MENINELNFIKNLLKEITENDFIKRVTVFNHFENFIIKAILRCYYGIIYEHTEYVWIKDSNEFYNAIMGGENYIMKNGKCVFVYIPYVFKSKLGNIEKRFIFRIERYDGKKYSYREVSKIKDLINKKMADYYIVDFENIKKLYSTNLSKSGSLGSIFAKSIREKEGFKFMLRGIERFFNFDRIRLYRVDETKNTLCGVYSIDRILTINDMSHEISHLKKGVSSLVDVVMGGENIVIKNNIVYLPLVIDYKKIGLLVVDNLLSRIEIEPHQIELLKSLSSLIAIAIENIILFEKIQEMSLYDELTKLPLRRYLNQRFQEEFYRAERFNQNLSLLWIDIDYFKEINDNYGHQVGDMVLKEVSSIIMKSLRKIDFPSRYGGDEIIILLPQSSEIEALGLAKRLLEEVRKLKIDISSFGINKSVELTLSIGISSYPTDAKTMEDLLSKADEALYWVKSNGRNNAKTFKQFIKEKETKKTI